MREFRKSRMLLVFIAALLSISQIIYLKSSIFEIIEHTVSPKSTTDLLKEISHHARRGFIFDCSTSCFLTVFKPHLSQDPNASWSIDDLVNSKKVSFRNDDVTIIQDELAKIERIKAKRLPQVICIGVPKCGTGKG